jgi:hypothetical protein
MTGSVAGFDWLPCTEDVLVISWVQVSCKLIKARILLKPGQVNYEVASAASDREIRGRVETDAASRVL